MCYLSHCVSFTFPSPLSHAHVHKFSASSPQPGSDLERHAASDCAHLQSEPASQRHPSVEEEWYGVGLEFNHFFGYGVLDAGAMVKMAKNWKMVPERFHCMGGSVQDPE